MAYEPNDFDAEAMPNKPSAEHYESVLIGYQYTEMPLTMARSVEIIRSAAQALANADETVDPRDAEPTGADLRHVLHLLPTCADRDVVRNIYFQQRNEIARLRAELVSTQRQLEEETEIVSKIWGILGNPSFQSLKRKTIYDLITDMKTKIARLKALLVEAKDFIKSHDWYETEYDGRMYTVCIAACGGGERDEHTKNCELRKLLAKLEVK